VSLLGGIGGKKIKNNDSGSKKRTPGEIRIQKDMAELDGGKVATITFPNPNDMTVFNVVVKPDSGYWKGELIVKRRFDERRNTTQHNTTQTEALTSLAVSRCTKPP